MREDGVVGDCDLLGRIKMKLTAKFARTCHKNMRGGGEQVYLYLPFTFGDRCGWIVKAPPGNVTYLLTPWCRVLLEKLTGLQLVKKFPTFHGTRRFITALTSVRHLSLSWASPTQSIYPHPTSWRSILILSTHLRLSLPSGLLPSGFPTKILYTPSPHPYAPHAQPISFFSILLPAQYWVRSTVQII